MDLSDSDMDTSSLSSSVSSEEGELEAEVEKSIEENHGDLGIAEEDQLADLLAENRQLKKKLQLFEASSDPNCLCTIIWQNISNSDTAKIVRLLEKAKIESNQSKSKSKEESLLGYEHVKRPFTKKYFDLSKETEFDNLFIVDKNSTSINAEVTTPTYQSLSIKTPEVQEIPLTILATRPAKSNPCFNCGLEGHPVRECPKPKDFRAINKNRLLYMAAAPSEKRYWEDKASKFNPGELSPALREALNLSADAPPPWYNKMLKYGYPPGYTREIGYSKDDLVIVEQASEASQIGKPVTGSCITPTIMFPGIDNKKLIQVSYAIASGTPVDIRPEAYSKSDVVNEIIEMKESTKKKEKKGIKTKEKVTKKGEKQKKETGEGKGKMQKKKQAKATGDKKEGSKKDEQKQKENSLKKTREENILIEEPQSFPQWSDASEGRYEPTVGTGVWKALHPMLKKRKSEKDLMNSSNANDEK